MLHEERFHMLSCLFKESSLLALSRSVTPGLGEEEGEVHVSMVVYKE